MIYLIPFTIIGGAIASFVFFLIYKRHIKKYGTVMEKSFVINAPKIFGTINIILALFIGIWFIVNPSAFSTNEAIENKFLFIFLSIFTMYFHILALPLSIGSGVLSIFLKTSLSKIKFLYYILTNIMASILLFIFNYLILN